MQNSKDFFKNRSGMHSDSQKSEKENDKINRKESSDGEPKFF